MYLGTNEVQKIYLGSTQVYGRQWTPADITTFAWFDAADAATINLNGSNVSQWDDKSGNSYNFLQGTANEQPLYEPTGYNGKGTLTFNGTTNHLPNAPLAAAVGTNDFTILAVVTLPTVSGHMISLSGPSARRGYLFGHADGLFETNFGSSALKLGAQSTPGANVIIGSELRDTNTVNESFLNGASIGSGNPTMSDVYTLLVVGALNEIPTGLSNLRCSEIIISSNALSPADRQKADGYLAHKWNLTGSLPADHPYKNAAPTI